MPTINVRINDGGRFQPAQIDAPIGPDNNVYRINDVPDGVTYTDVIRKLSSIGLAHPRTLGNRYWTYSWRDIVDLPRGSIINRWPEAKQVSAPAKH